jgi:hypothetical protein
MKRHSSRSSQPVNQFEIICHLGDQLRDEYGTVRYAEYIEHTGRQWTIRATWERLENGVWVTLELPLENY